MTESTFKVRSPISDEASPCANNIKKPAINGKSTVVDFDFFTPIPEYIQQAKLVADRMLERDERRNSDLEFDKKENPSKKDVLNPEDMPNGKLVSIDPTSQEQQQTLIELLDQMQAKIDQLKLLIDKNPELATLHIVGFNPTTAVLKSVREAMWGIFNATGKFIGRNSAEVIAEEAKIMLYKIAKSRQQEVENNPIDTVVDEIVMPNLCDEDLKNIANPTHSAINLSIYRTTMSRLYYALQRRRYRAA